jgi:transposase InsO family protein
MKKMMMGGAAGLLGMALVIATSGGAQAQLWVADITYIAIARDFVYLAVILDAWSRRVVRYALGRQIDTRLSLAALRAAINTRHPAPGLIHHSDRGAQCAAQPYRSELAAHGRWARWADAATRTTTARRRAS